MTIRVPQSTRLEIKFASYDIHSDVILHWLRVHPACFITPYPSRLVNNVYFDTHDYAAFSENLLGSSSRTKVRYRWYGEEQGPAVGVLEIKFKRNYFGWKTRYRIASPPTIEWILGWRQGPLVGA